MQWCVFRSLGAATSDRSCPVDALLNATSDRSGLFLRGLEELAAEAGIPEWFMHDYVSVVGRDNRVYVEVLFGSGEGLRRFEDPETAMRLLAMRVAMMSSINGGAPGSSHTQRGLSNNEDSHNRIACENRAWRAELARVSSPVPAKTREAM